MNQTQTDPPGCSHMISAVALLIGLLFLLLYAGQFVQNANLRQLALLPYALLIPFVLVMAFRVAYAFLLISAVAIILFSLFTRKARWYGLMLKIVALILIGLFTLYPYSPNVYPTDGVEMMLPTRQGRVWNGLWLAQSMIDVKPCTYVLLGWDADNQLYYDETCNQRTTTWRFAPDKQMRRRVSDVPEKLVSDQNSLDKFDTLFELSSVNPGMQRYDLWLYPYGMFSAEKNYAALVSKNLYGPEDVIILTLKK